MFRILYLFILSDPPSWVAYTHAAVLFLLMGLTYVQSSRRGVGFMVVFLAMAGIFMVDVLAYIPFYAYVRARDRKRGAPARRGTHIGRSGEAPAAAEGPVSPE